MSPSKVPPSVLAALGLVGIASQEGCFGPCLDMAVETGDPSDSGDTDSDSDDSDSDSDTEDSDTGPCLEAPPEQEVGSEVPLPITGEGQRVKGEVLDRGVLPDDVAKLLKDRSAD